ncbi:hypothetical protein SAMD00019534_049680 [Acytostelium subglobosum LB1]|uniref:hypothetical protein n=1 Tax=Acytostelium subglobosum LB1 TaxID=1410327 RepID=UPI00064490A9|nr:hypothetical protein SAMD00019534_049680 [Acytostelium subglobosum LB1]GAM21793.1 hypothetical protein SAMD00019534_049680 [Acytostelium subglobosum LB1]|eukprot:XP_012754893.1 hypothetical protein SAMD00019534_049680 [Acytostelium subglobosum LB1]
MKSIILILILAVTFSVVRSEIKYFSQRSADIIIESPIFKQNSLLFLKGNVYSNVELTNMKDVQIASLISHTMGTIPMGSDDRTGFPKLSVFNKPKLNLFFGLDGVSSADLSKASLSFLNTENAINVEKSFYPMDSVAELATVATGVTPDVHGIVGSHWETPGAERMNAYREKAIALSANLADVLTQTYAGQSLIISGSSSSAMTGASAVHRDVAKQYPNGNYHAVFSGAYQMQSLYGYNRDEQFKFTITDIERMLYANEFRNFVLPTGWSTKLAGDQLTIFSAVGSKVTIDIDQYSALLKELTFVYKTVRMFSEKNAFNGAVADSVPDMISFTFATLNGMDKESALYSFALQLVDKTMQSAYEQLNGLYGRIACEVLVMPGMPAADQQLIDQIAEVAGEHIVGAASAPTVYLQYDSKAERQTLCDELEQVVSAEIKVHCIAHPEFDIRLLQINASSSNSYNSPDFAADSQATALFQVFLFLPIILVLAVIFGSLLMMRISFDAQKDTLLFRTARRTH